MIKNTIISIAVIATIAAATYTTESISSNGLKSSAVVKTSTTAGKAGDLGTGD